MNATVNVTPSNVHSTPTLQNPTPTSLTSSSFQHVTCKKISGTIILNESTFTFYPAKAAPDNGDAATPAPLRYPWESIAKHQVSPISHPRHLLKVTLHKSPGNGSSNGSAAKKSQTYEFQSRTELERIRNDISSRLIASRRNQALNGEPIVPDRSTSQSQSQSSSFQQNGNRKRKLDHMSPITSGSQPGMSKLTPHKANTHTQMDAAKDASTSSSTFTLTPSENLVARSSLLASDRNIRDQYSRLAIHPATGTSTSASTTATSPSPSQQSPTVADQDFWTTHIKKNANQAAKTHGFVSKGISSAMKSSLDIQITGGGSNASVSKPIKLGVEEMRQIFIMYPAVHDTYEEKVPLELSEEQFWRKYLESEYFHRDRGRMGSSARTVVTQDAMMDPGSKPKLNSKEKSKAEEEEDHKRKSQEEDKEREETARMGAASSNDIFSRKEVELRRKDGPEEAPSLKSLAVGQFDLTATANTERGNKILLNSNDLHPFDDRGRKVIEKYNKHWAMVLNPEEASAGCDLTELARRSTLHSLKGDDDAKVNGGFGKEFKRLVGFAGADDKHVDHVKGMGNSGGNDGYDSDTVLFEELNLKNIDAYAGKKLGDTMRNDGADEKTSIDKMKEDAFYGQLTLEEVTSLSAPSKDGDGNGDGNTKAFHNLKNAFPDPKLGNALLQALTKHMVLDSMTEKDTAKMTKSMPEAFRKKLTSFTRRSNELLRHFFALRHVMENEKKLKKSGASSSSTSKSSQKLKKIVTAMEGVFSEIDALRKDREQSEQARKMCLPIINQMDWAFKLNTGSKGSGGGFVTVED